MSISPIYKQYEFQFMMKYANKVVMSPMPKSLQLKVGMLTESCMVEELQWPITNMEEKLTSQVNLHKVMPYMVTVVL